jgi:hypothetical protein
MILCIVYAFVAMVVQNVSSLCSIVTACIYVCMYQFETSLQQIVSERKKDKEVLDSTQTTKNIIVLS